MALRADVRELLTAATHVLLDVDGVLCLGDQPLADASDVVAALSAFAPVVVTTNDSRRGPAAQRARVTAAGVPPDLAIVAAADAVLAQLRAMGVTRITVVGTDGLRDHLDAQGLSVEALHGRRGGVSAPTVVVGCVPDPAAIDASAIAGAIGARPWLATNADLVVPTPDGPIPDTGAVLARIGPLVGRPPLVAGKPAASMTAAVSALVGHLGRPIVVGDGEATDLAWARANGWPSVHVSPRDCGGDITVATLLDLFG